MFAHCRIISPTRARLASLHALRARLIWQLEDFLLLDAYSVGPYVHFQLPSTHTSSFRPVSLGELSNGGQFLPERIDAKLNQNLAVQGSTSASDVWRTTKGR